MIWIFSETKENFIVRSKDTKLAEKLGTAFVGNVNETAQTLCEKGFVQTLDDPRRFISNYQLKLAICYFNFDH